LGEREIDNASLSEESWYSTTTSTTETMTNLDDWTVESEYYNASEEESDDKKSWECRH